MLAFPNSLQIILKNESMHITEILHLFKFHALFHELLLCSRQVLSADAAELTQELLFHGFRGSSLMKLLNDLFQLYLFFLVHYILLLEMYKQ